MAGGLDLKKLREMQKGISKKAGAGDSIFLFSNKIPEDLDIRLLPPKPNMNGVYFLEQTGWWVNGKFHLVNESDDVIDAEIKAAKDTKDKTLLALLDKKKDGAPLIKKENRYVLPILTLDTKYDDDDNLVSCKVDDVKVLVAKPTLMMAINEVVTARPYQNGTEHGIMDRTKGYNIIIGKVGKGLDTKYRAIGWTQQMEMDEEYYKDDKVPDILTMAKKATKSDAYLSSVIRNYLYGEDILTEEEEEIEENEAPKPRPVSQAATHKRSTPPSEEAPKPARRPAPVTSTTKPKRSIIDDAAGDMDDID